MNESNQSFPERTDAPSVPDHSASPHVGAAISIIIPVYNTEQFLPACLRSVLNQTFTDFEIIIVDDGSTDRSGLIADGYAQKDARIRVIHKENGGLSDARNVGLTHATADIIGYVDADDEIRPNMLQVMYDAMQSHKADIVVCGYYKVWPRKVQEVDAVSRPGDYDSNTALEWLLTDKVNPAACNKLYRRKVLTKAFPKGYCHEDNAVMAHWFAAAERITFLPDLLYLYRQRRNSIMHRRDNAKSSYDWFHCLTLRCDAVSGLPALHQTARQRMSLWGWRLLKRLANGGSSSKDKRRYAALLAKELRPFLRKKETKLSRKSYIRLKFISHFPSTYVTYRKLIHRFTVIKEERGERREE